VSDRLAALPAPSLIVTPPGRLTAAAARESGLSGSYQRVTSGVAAALEMVVE
jgi:hypothetical protein